MERKDGRRLFKGINVAEVEGARGRGRSKKIWDEGIRELDERKKLGFPGRCHNSSEQE